MQITRINCQSLRAVLKACNEGFQVAGFTFKPGFSNGLFICDRYEHLIKPGNYVGFNCSRKD